MVCTQVLTISKFDVRFETVCIFRKLLQTCASRAFPNSSQMTFHLIVINMSVLYIWIFRYYCICIIKRIKNGLRPHAGYWRTESETLTTKKRTSTGWRWPATVTLSVTHTTRTNYCGFCLSPVEAEQWQNFSSKLHAKWQKWRYAFLVLPVRYVRILFPKKRNKTRKPIAVH